MTKEERSAKIQELLAKEAWQTEPMFVQDIDFAAIAQYMTDAVGAPVVVFPVSIPSWNGNVRFKLVAYEVPTPEDPK